MRKEEFLYEYMQKTAELNNKLMSLEKKKIDLQHEKQINSLNMKAVNLSKLLHLSINLMKSANGRKGIVMLNINKSISAVFANQCVLLSPTYHIDFKKFLSNIEKLEKLIGNLAQCPDIINFKLILQKFEKLCFLYFNHFMNGINNGTICKGFREDINYVKQIEQEKITEHVNKNDSDLNADPHDSNSVHVDAHGRSQFATSSPIPKHQNEDK